MVDSQVFLATKYFTGTKYQPVLSEILRSFSVGDKAQLNSGLERLPTWETLLNELVEKVKGKSVYKTVKRISEGVEVSPWEKTKGLFSLGTHAAIECENGNLEFKLVVDKIYENLGRVIYGEGGNYNG